MRQPLNTIVKIGQLICLCGIVFLAGCGKSTNVITVYTSVNSTMAQPILQAFQDKNPEWKLNPVYESEATPSGLYQRILEEKKNPQADVFWNQEILRTLQLKKAGLLAPYASSSAGDIPAQYKDPENTWAGLSAKIRVMIINKDLVPESETPASIPALGDPKYRGKTCMAKPESGPAVTQMTALYTTWGKGILQLRLKALSQTQIALLPDSAHVCDAVASGKYAYGITDTDTALAASNAGKPVRIAFFDPNQTGIILIPNTVALILNSPNPDGGKKLIDYLLSPEVEEQLAQCQTPQIPLRASVSRPEGIPDLSTLKIMEIPYDQAADNVEPCLELLRNVFH